MLLITCEAFLYFSNQKVMNHLVLDYDQLPIYVPASSGRVCVSDFFSSNIVFHRLERDPFRLDRYKRKQKPNHKFHIFCYKYSR